MNDLKNVERAASDGRLLATSFELDLCEHCDSAHYNLMDRNGRVFCTMLVGPEQFLAVADKLIEFDAHVQRRVKLRGPR